MLLVADVSAGLCKHFKDDLVDDVTLEYVLLPLHVEVFHCSNDVVSQFVVLIETDLDLSSFGNCLNLLIWRIVSLHEIGVQSSLSFDVISQVLLELDVSLLDVDVAVSGEVFVCVCHWFSCCHHFC